MIKFSFAMLAFISIISVAKIATSPVLKNSPFNIFETKASNAKRDPIIDITFGAMAGLGYGADVFLDDCSQAGLEMVASAFMAYNWISNDVYTLPEKIIGPIPDITQIGLQTVYMFRCITGRSITEVSNYVAINKVVQSIFGIYQATFSFIPSDQRFDLFIGTFSALKMLFASLDTIKYFKIKGWDING
ncbi:UNKNOWN [Stylonychia lemnae]|uniref:Uncharacterized protein n=1 Tax=Stylonychia lemnae TaxID=5949 RepID=A0A078B7M3_STYLE|nr:UNKNOWN [Stylonychia lemnae]|eukprot:CDW89553.1 UNKNOWN [Stylonychia lemnae]